MWPVSMPSMTTTWPSRFPPRRCLRASGPCCAGAHPEQTGGLVKVAGLSLDSSTYRVVYNDQMLKLGPNHQALHYLMNHAERVHSRAQLLDKVWGDHVFIEERTVDVHVKRLRESHGRCRAHD